MAVIDGKWLSKEGLTYFWSKIKAIFTKQTETNVIANLGAKNNADFNFGGIVSNANIKPGTIVCAESNGTFSFSGTSADKNYAAYVLKQFLLKAGTYKITGVSGGSNTKYWMRVGTGTTNTALFNFYDGERKFNLSDDTLITVQIVIYANQTVSNLVFKPMIRPSEITDDTFVPYAPTNRELYETKTEQTETNVIANLGAKNLLKVASTTQTVNGVTFTVNDDQTITVNGTASATITYVIAPNAQAILIPDGTYVLSGCPSGGGDTTFDLRWYLYSSGKSAYDQGSGASVAKNGNTTSSNVAIVIKSGVTVNNLVFKPMVRPAEITDSSFKPYAPSNRELYETKVTMQQVYGDAAAIPANSDLNNYTTPGIYYALVVNVPSMANTPYRSTGLRLVVEKNTLSGSAVFQTLYPTSRTHSEFYRRLYEGGSWSSWYKFEGTQI